MNKIGIIITTFLRDDLLKLAIQSIKNQLRTNWSIIIVDQNSNLDKLLEYSKSHENMYYVPVAYNSGLSYSRNSGITFAKKLGCTHCIISADSITFNDINPDNLILVMNKQKIDLLGLHLEDRIEWEATLDLIKGQYFELDFIEKLPLQIITPCDIVRNFFIAKIDSLLAVMWDNNLKMREHEDFFWRYKQKGYKVGCTKLYSGKYIGQKSHEYQGFRDQNMREGLSYLQKKYNISGWVNYKHIERIRK